MTTDDFNNLNDVQRWILGQVTDELESIKVKGLPLDARIKIERAKAKVEALKQINIKRF